MSGITVHGPYKHRTRWRLHVKEGRRTIASPSYPTRKEANEAKQGYLELEHADELWSEVAQLEEQLARARARAESSTREPKTVDELIEEYVMYLRDQKQRPSGTVATTRYQLRGILGPVLDMPAKGLTRQRAAALYRERARDTAAATHHGNLGQARTLWRWGSKRQLCRAGVWDEVERIGKPKQGKDQLHPTAAVMIYERALEQTLAGPPPDHRRRNQPLGSAAVMILLIVGMRPKEIIRLTPRDADRGMLFVWKSKTRSSRRWMRLPGEMWRALEPLVSEARAERRERLFPFQVGWVNDNVKRMCRELDLPEVCAYSLRGTHATLATEAGATAAMVAKQLGHAGTGITSRHYIDPAAAIEAAASKVYLELSSAGREHREALDTRSDHQSDCGQPGSGHVLPTKKEPAEAEARAGSFPNDSSRLPGCEGGDSNPHRLPH